MKGLIGIQEKSLPFLLFLVKRSFRGKWIFSLGGSRTLPISSTPSYRPRLHSKVCHSDTYNMQSNRMYKRIHITRQIRKKNLGLLKHSGSSKCRKFLSAFHFVRKVPDHHSGNNVSFFYPVETPLSFIEVFPKLISIKYSPKDILMYLVTVSQSVF